MKKFTLIFATAVAILFFSTSSFAQDATEVDPDHYKVEFENDQVRVLRITYGAGEKSVMHEHPEGMAIFLTDGEGKFTLPVGTSVETSFKSGEFSWMPAQEHQPENTGDKPFEVIQIEMKTKKE